jgi:purine-binding chemotaxis protein CheW
MTATFVTFEVGDHTWGLEVHAVREVLPVHATTRVPRADETIAGLVNLRGQVVLSLDLRTRLGIPGERTPAEQMMIVVDRAAEPISLVVDRIGEVVEVEDADFDDPPRTLGAELRPFVLGAYKLTDRLLLALDVDAVTSR